MSVSVSDPGYARESLRPSSYMDIGSLNRLKANTPENLGKAAAQFEGLFLDMWIKSMRDASQALVSEHALSSNETRFHQQMLDHQWSVHLAANGGVGLAEVLERQLGGGPAIPAANLADKGLRQLQQQPIPVMRAQQSGEETSSINGDISVQKMGYRSAIFSSKEEFVSTLKDSVEALAVQHNLPVSGVLAQAALETGWGQHVIHDADGQPSFNLFGIKAGSTWNGAKAEIASMEFEAGISSLQPAAFRAYESIAGAISDFADFLTSDRYQQVIGQGHDAAGYGQALAESGYATDPNYAAKLRALSQQVATILNRVAGAPDSTATASASRASASVSF